MKCPTCFDLLTLRFSNDQVQLQCLICRRIWVSELADILGRAAVFKALLLNFPQNLPPDAERAFKGRKKS